MVGIVHRLVIGSRNEIEHEYQAGMTIRQNHHSSHRSSNRLKGVAGATSEPTFPSRWLLAKGDSAIIGFFRWTVTERVPPRASRPAASPRRV
jgi:hypothetical protein